MPPDYSVYFEAKLAKVLAQRLRFQRCVLTFVPTGDLVAGFTELTLEVTATNWKTLLKARGGTEDDYVWQALLAFWAPAFAPQGATSPNPARANAIPDKIVIGRRTNAEPTKWTATVTGDLDGRYTIGALGFGEVFFDAVGKTATEIRTGLVTAYNLLAALADVSTAANNGGAALDVTTDTDGFPFIVYVKSTGSPITLVNATVAGDYEADLDAIVLDNDPLAKTGKYYFIHDLQWDDQTNAQGVQWCRDKRSGDSRKTYCYVGQSYHASIPNAAVDTDPASVLNGLLAPLAEENNDRGSLWYHPTWQFEVCTLLGRCIGNNLGRINFAQRELVGITPADLGDNEVVATLKKFNFLSPESPKGNTKWGYLSSGRYIDDLWAEDWLSYEGQTALLNLLVSEDALDYTDEGGIAQGKSCIAQALLKYQGPDYRYLVENSISVVAGLKADQPGQDLEDRTFVDYTVGATRRNLINRYGSATTPIAFTISV